MKLFEYQAKKLLAKYGVPIPRGSVATTPEQAEEIASDLGQAVVLKGQVHSGGRGKAGAVKIAKSPEQARQIAADLIGKTLFFAQAGAHLRVDTLLLEEALPIKQEIYVAITQDRASQRDVLIVSTMGGMDIELVAHENPEAISKTVIDPLLGLTDYAARDALFDAGFEKTLAGKAAGLLKGLYAAYVGTDATLAEINPLVITEEGALIAGDAKWLIDDNAIFRQPEIAALATGEDDDPIEVEARRRGIQYVRLEGGEIGIIGNGAGLVMTTMDEVKRAGGTPADFLDIGGGAKAESVRSSLEIVLSDPNVKGVLFNIFGGITRGDEVAKGIIEGLSTLNVKVPIVVRLSGTRAEEGAALLAGASIVAAQTMQEAAQQVVALANKARKS
ncbi:MAG: ADP-forming succinate--CoA ligase subunit beta [Capsulimonadaceae bacterium]|nr:ADP-forming succinate--CoA ligase subunit beta [Capsulimonadaceae bacterium]